MQQVQPYMQLECFYFTSSPSKINAQNFLDGHSESATGLPDSINAFNIAPGGSSRIASYWPSIIFQDGSGNLQEVHWNTSQGFQGPTAPSTAAVGSAGSPLLVLPLTPSHSGRDLRVVYRGQDGKLKSFERGENNNVLASSDPLPFSLPADAGLGGFATATSSTSLTTYLIWQDSQAGDKDAGFVQIAYDDGSGGGWKGPVSDPVFKGADVPTNIACLTAAGSPGGDSTISVPLEVGKNDMNRCYFQVGGAVKEVLWNGQGWVDLGFVRMP